MRECEIVRWCVVVCVRVCEILRNCAEVCEWRVYDIVCGCALLEVCDNVSERACGGNNVSSHVRARM